MDIAEIVKQLKSCDYECIAGKLENNVAFIELEERAKSYYQNDRYLGEKVFTENGDLMEVVSLSASFESMAPSGIVSVFICQDIYENKTTVPYLELFTPEEFKEKETKEALEVLKKHGYKQVHICDSCIGQQPECEARNFKYGIDCGDIIVECPDFQEK